MTVRWNATYPDINLYVMWNYNISVYAPINNQTQIVTGYPDRSVQWTIACNPDCSKPYVFHAVNANGSPDEQNGGGYWSRLFWVREQASFAATGTTGNSGSASTSGSTTSTYTSSSSITTSATISMTGTMSTFGLPLSSASADSGTSPVAHTLSAVQSVSSVAVSVPTPSLSVTASTKDSTRDEHGTIMTALAAGIGADASVMVAIVGAFFIWRHYHRNGAWPLPDGNEMVNMKRRNSLPLDHATAYQRRPPYEVQGMKTPQQYEKPSWQTDPYELPGRHQ